MARRKGLYATATGITHSASSHVDFQGDVTSSARTVMLRAV